MYTIPAYAYVHYFCYLIQVNNKIPILIFFITRRMFPAIQVQISGLNPEAPYCVFMEMTPASNCRYRYAASGGWAPAGGNEAHSPCRFFVHQDSPATGKQWMSQVVSFDKLKLTNTATPPPGQVVLNSMHKYQPKIIIANTSDLRDMLLASSVTKIFRKTSFIAVTAYQVRFARFIFSVNVELQEY